MALSQRLKQLRIESGVQQKALAEKLSIGRQSMSHYETGKREPDLKTLGKLADYYGVTVDYLIGRTDIRNGRVATEEELYKVLPEEVVAKIKQDKLKIIVDDKKLDSRTVDEILKVLEANNYL